VVIQIRSIRLCRGRNRRILVALLVLLAVGLMSISVHAIMRSTHYVNWYSVPSGWAVDHGPHNGVLQLAPYLDDTDPNGKAVCVGWRDASSGEWECTLRYGSGAGSKGNNGNFYDRWWNWDTITINIHGHTVLIRN
jgi:hypothetical protein